MISSCCDDIVLRVELPDETYARLLALRTGMRHFERWSEQRARAAGLTPAQHQLLLAIRGHDDPRGPTIGEVADYLLLRHHSAVGLIDRAVAAGLVVRVRTEDDHRVVRLRLTDDGARRLEALSAQHVEELARLAHQDPGTWEGLAPVQRVHGLSGGLRVEAARVTIARVVDEIGKDQESRVLVDRLWPRGLAKDRAPFAVWAKDLAPSTELRIWYGHAPERFEEFARRYRLELSSPSARTALEQLRQRAKVGDLVLLTAARDLPHSGAAVIQAALIEG